MWKRLFFLSATLAVAKDEDEYAAPPAPPPPPKRKAAARSPAPPPREAAPGETWHDKMADLRRLKADGQGVNYQIGHWSYGDYKQNVDVHTVSDCSRECDSDSLCMHWQFNLEKNRCDLKTGGGSFAPGAEEWVLGHSRHYREEL